MSLCLNIHNIHNGSLCSSTYSGSIEAIRDTIETLKGTSKKGVKRRRDRIEKAVVAAVGGDKEIAVKELRDTHNLI